MRKVSSLKSKLEVDYLRKHDLTEDEIRKSPLFQSLSLSKEEMAEVKAIFLQIGQIMFECIKNQETTLASETNKLHIATKQLIEQEQFKRKAA